MTENNNINNIDLKNKGFSVGSDEINNMWNYYLTLEQDLSSTSRYLEPKGQESVFSFEFAKLVVLACTEVEAVFKALCLTITGKEAGNIGEYKHVIYDFLPQIVDIKVTVSRLGEDIKPFAEWKTGTLTWWKAYQNVKHSRSKFFYNANYMNAVTAVGALHILILFLAEICSVEVASYKAEYINSIYCIPFFVDNPEGSFLRLKNKNT